MNVNNIVESALKQLGVLAAGENAEANELVDAIDVLRGLLAQWATQNLYVYKTEKIELNLDGLATVSPNELDSPDVVTSISKISDQGILDDKPIHMIRDLNGSNPDAEITYSVNGEVWTFTGKGNLNFKALTLPYKVSPGDELNLPPNYERPLILSLAVEIAPMFGIDPSPNLLNNQAIALRMLKNSNVTPIYATNSAVEIPAGVRCYGRH